MKKLAVGIQHFPKLISGGYLYVDKTELIYRLISGEEGHFLSRPRRFGKSLLLSTLASIFQGERDLFKDTWIGSSDYTWEQYPVLRLDFSIIVGDDKEALELSLQAALQNCAKRMGILLSPGPTPVATFSTLISEIALQKGKEVVILIDEYDNPLLKVLGNNSKLQEIRTVLNEFYTVVKSLNEFIRYVFITGVSKFSKVSLFSGMNNLKDISLETTYGAIAGITEEELRRYYTEWFEATAKKRNEDPQHTHALVRKWYNGYCFAPDAVKVYNPVSLHYFLDGGRLSNFWFGTATPTFAINLIRSENYPVLDLDKGVVIGASLEQQHEVTLPNLIPLLFQTGYLTIIRYDAEERLYHLAFPNEEVRLSFFDHLLMGFTHVDESILSLRFIQFADALRAENLKDFFNLLNALFAEIPYTLHIAKEAYYHSLIYLIIRALRLKVETEVATSVGRLDLTVFANNTLYLFEFKFDASAKEALDQIIQKGYADRYKHSGKKIVLVGANVNREKRMIDDWIEQLLS